MDSSETISKRHKIVRSRFNDIQKEVFGLVPDLKGSIYPSYFYNRIADELGITWQTVKNIILKSRNDSDEKRLTRI